MIIVCKNCHTSFLIPTTVLPPQGRTVRCAKCGNLWKEVPAKRSGSESHTSQQQKSSIPPLASAPQKKEASDSAPQPPPSPFERAEATIKEPFDAAKWLARFKSLTALSLLISFGFLLFFAVVFVVGHKYIIQYWPHMQTSYVMLGLAEDPLQDNLVLHNIVSERRYSDGAMQLFVTGEIHSNAEKRQVIPALSVEALGPDGRIIESWRIAPPKATIDPNTTIPFTSSTIAPEGTVVEVNLSFTEAPHDER